MITLKQVSVYKLIADILLELDRDNTPYLLRKQAQ